jgi:hypothetical protein
MRYCFPESALMYDFSSKSNKIGNNLNGGISNFSLKSSREIWMFSAIQS